jgi:hypothetical protein
MIPISMRRSSSAAGPTGLPERWKSLFEIVNGERGGDFPKSKIPKVRCPCPIWTMIKISKFLDAIYTFCLNLQLVPSAHEF